MALAVVQRHELLEQVWELHDARDYIAIVELVGELPLEEHLKEPEIGLTLCYAWYQLGELNHSVSLIQQLTPVCERRGNTRLCRRCTNSEALIRLARGELKKAEPLLQKVLALAEEAGDQQYLAWVQNNLGILYHLKGLWEFSASYIRRAIAAGQRLGDPVHLLQCHVNASATFHKVGSLSMARWHLEQALDLSRTCGSPSEVAHVELGFAFQHELEGDLPLAESFADRAFQRFGSIRHSKGQGGVYQVYGRIYFKKGKLEDAERCLLMSLTHASAASHREVEACIMEDLARVSLAKGLDDDFAKRVQTAIATYQEMGNRTEAARLNAWLKDNRYVG